MARAKFREAVYERDQGVCEACGFDTKRLVHAHLKLVRRTIRKDYRFWVFLKRMRGLLQEAGFQPGPSPMTKLPVLWEADHVLPLVLGGRDELENLRTLCVPCHREESTRLARYRKLRRKTKQRHFPHNFVLE